MTFQIGSVVCFSDSGERGYVWLSSDPTDQGNAGGLGINLVSGLEKASERRIIGNLRCCGDGAKPEVLPADGRGSGEKQGI